MVLDTAIGTDGMAGARLYGGGTNWHMLHDIYKAVLTEEHEYKTWQKNATLKIKRVMHKGPSFIYLVLCDSLFHILHLLFLPLTLCVLSAALLWLSICTSLDIKANTYGLGTCWLLNFFCFHPAWHSLWNSVVDETFCTNLLKIKNLIIEWFGWFELERNMKIILFQPPCSGQGHLPDEVAQSSILEHFQGWYSHNVS